MSLGVCAAAATTASACDASSWKEATHHVMAIPKELSLLIACAGIFGSFSYFAVLQEDVYKKKYVMYNELRSSLKVGLDKLLEAGDDVAKMKEELNAKRMGTVQAWGEPAEQQV